MIPDFSKYADGLVPVIAQDIITQKVLMLGFMNEEAYTKTQNESKVTFFSRSKQRLWTKGETSGNFLLVKEVLADCDNDLFVTLAQILVLMKLTRHLRCKNWKILLPIEKIILRTVRTPHHFLKKVLIK
jgi:phosphoribosyl-AMP cyclohydrolase